MTPNMKQDFSQLKRAIIEENFPLSQLTTYRIGGPADLLLKIDRKDELVESINICREKGYPFIVLGGGSNILVNDRGVRGVVILDRYSRYEFSGRKVTTGSGVLLKNVAFEAVRKGLSGIEFGCCIYGTIGGAVYGNAGAYGKNIGETLREAEVLTADGRIEKVGPDFFEFEYRSSALKRNGAILLECTLELEHDDPVKLLEFVQYDMDRRLERHPTKEGSAGSYFKNLPPPGPGERRIPTGQVLDELGAKGMRVGNAYVYSGHANYLVNPGNATARDILQLADNLKKLVREKRGLEITEEVIFVREEPDQNVPLG